MTVEVEPAIKIEVNLGENGGICKFTSTQEINEWINKETREWTWLSSINKLSNIVNKQHAPYSELRKSCQEITNLLAKNPENNIDHQVNIIRNYLNDIYSKEKALHSSSSKAKFIFKLKENDPEIAGYALGIFIGASFPNLGNGFDKLIQGAFEAFNFNKGLASERLELAQTTFQEQTDKLYSLIANAETEKEKIVKQFHDLRNSINVQIEEKRTELEDLVSSNKQTLGQLVSSSTEKLNEFEKIFHEKIALKAPVKYWGNRKKFHNLRVIIYASLSLIWGIGGIGILWWLAQHWLGNDTTWAKIHSNIPLWHFPIAIMALSVFVWMERILVRLFISNAHLKTDAGERIVMIQTYLSLLEEGKVLAEDDRKLILSTIFRPNKTGIVQDDGMPNPLLSFLQSKNG